MDSAYVETFTQAYIECALWASTDSDGEPIGEENVSRLADETTAKLEADAAEFCAAQAELLDAADLSPESAGHDFWLTRNHHGAGFWDRGLGELGDKLSDAARAEGEQDLYWGDDGLLYLA